MAANAAAAAAQAANAAAQDVHVAVAALVDGQEGHSSNKVNELSDKEDFDLWWYQTSDLLEAAGLLGPLETALASNDQEEEIDVQALDE